MAREVCILLKGTDKVQRPGKPELTATQDQLIADGWKQKAEGVNTIVFEKEN